MVQLKRFELDFEKAFAYAEGQTTDINTLATNLKELVNWESGRFFAYLPKDVQLENIHAFKHGKITTDIDKVKYFILNELKRNNQLSCIFDDFSDEFEDGDNGPLFQTCGLFYKKEVYFLVDQKIASFELMQTCFFVSDAIWHSLCLLTKVDLSHKKDKELTLQEIKAICLNATLIVFGAYDGEGYVIWENGYLSNLEEIELND